MNTLSPPKYPRMLLRLLISHELFDDIDGDLTEIYNNNVQVFDIRKANYRYTITVLLSFRNIHLRRELTYFNPLVMYKNYLKISFRNLLKYKGYSFINIVGLALGMASCLLILLFVNNELSFDDFHEEKTNIYRLDEVQTFGAVSAQKVALSMYPMGPNLMLDFPEVVAFTRFWNMGAKTLVEYGDNQHYLESFTRIDSSFFSMFDFKLIDGNPSEVFQDEDDIIISETNAKRIFGNENPIGKVLRTSNNDVQYKITGIFEDVPDNSHLQFDALISTKRWDSENRQNGWGSNYLNTYLQLVPNANIEALEAQFDDFLVRHMNEEVLDYYELFLQPLTDVHLGSMDITHDYNNHKKFARSSVDIFLIIAFFVLLIASINFMNLSTARAATRGREVGVRKSVGAYRSQITSQFMVETVVLVFVSLLVAVCLCFLAVNPLSKIIDRDLSMALFLEPINFLVIIGVAVLIGLFSGLYPAIFMASYNPVKALKGDVSKGNKSVFRNGLVVFQYAIAIAIIIGTSLATRQLNFMQNMDLGFEKEMVVSIDMFGDTNQKYDLLRSELSNQGNVLGVTATTQRLGNNLHQTSMTYQGDTSRINGSSSFVVVENNFMDFFEMEIVEGRALSDDFALDSEGRSFVVNETLAKVLASDGSEVIGMPFHFGGNDTLGTVVGIVKDFNYNKLNLKVEPLFMSRQEWNWSEINVKIKQGGLKEGLYEIEQVWSTLFPQRPFQYKFLDDHLGEMYESEQQLTKVISILSVLAMIIASLGLLGLASFTVRQRLKEMGIRKVLGASIGQIVMILSKKFTLLVLIAFVIAAPVTYYLMGLWLNDYVYSVGLSIGVFLLVGLGSWLIALLTVSFQSIRVAKSNPVETLRIE